jgi:hypothetical protein
VVAGVVAGVVAMEEDWISLREFARRRGVRLSAVQKAVSDKRVPESAVRRNEQGHLQAIEFHAASAAWNTNTDVEQAARTAGGAATVVGQGGELPLESRGETGSTKSESAKGGEASALRTASAHGKQLQNQLLELELHEEIGRLVSVDEVRELAARRYRAIREQILTVPDRIADLLAAERDPARVHGLMKEELERVLHELSDAAIAESAGLASSEAPERVAA